MKKIEEIVNRIRLDQILKEYPRQVIKDESKVECAVLIPIYIKEDTHHILFTKRSEKVNHHRGQISFPGGVFSKDEDEDLLQTALRETQEEIGVDRKDIDIVGPISDIETITGFLITPYVGFIPYPYDFNPNPDEIDKIIEVPVKDIYGKETAELVRFGDEPYMHYAYTSGNTYIWGATARILKQFFDVIS